LPQTHKCGQYSEKADIRIKAQNLNFLSHIFLENNFHTAPREGTDCEVSSGAIRDVSLIQDSCPKEYTPR